jgi:very-short-patch-repair endonuclease
MKKCADFGHQLLKLIVGIDGTCHGNANQDGMSGFYVLFGEQEIQEKCPVSQKI